MSMLHEASSIDNSRILPLITLQRAETRKRKPRSPSRPGRHNVLLIFPSHRHRRHLRSLSSNSNLHSIHLHHLLPSARTAQSRDRRHPQKQLLVVVECFHTSCNSSARVCDAPGPPIKSTTRETAAAVRTPSSFQPCRRSFFLLFFGICPASTGLSWGDAIRSGHRLNTLRKTVSELKAESRHQNGHNARCRAIRLASRERRWIPAVSAIRGPGAAERHFFANDRHRNRRRRRQRWAEGCQRREEAERILPLRRGITSRDGADRRIVPGANTITPRALPEARQLDRQHQRLGDGASTRELNEQKSRTLTHVARLLPPHELPEAASPARCRSATNHEPTSGVVNAGRFSGGGRRYKPPEHCFEHQRPPTRRARRPQ